MTGIGNGAGGDDVVRDHLPDDTLLVFLSDTHIGGAPGSDIFESAGELTRLLVDLDRHDGPVELVLAGDFLDLLCMEDAGDGDRVAATIARPEYRELFARLRAFAEPQGHRVVYLVGNHDAEVWWNPRVRRSLGEAGLVDRFGLSYAASFASLPDQLVYCEHGNQFDPANALVDYANPLDTPVGAHVLTEMIRPIGSGAAPSGGLDLRELRHVFPVAAHPGPAEWLAGRIFYRSLGQVLRWLLVLLTLLVAAFVVYGGLAVLLGRSSGGPRALQAVLTEAAYGLAVLCFAAAVVFLSAAASPPMRSPPWRHGSRGWRPGRSGAGRRPRSAGFWRTAGHRRWRETCRMRAWRCSCPATPTPRRSRSWPAPTAGPR